MNNDDFSQLVRDHVQQKKRAMARKIVEREFLRESKRKKRKRADDYGDDSDEEVPRRNKTAHQEQQRRQAESNLQQSEDQTSSWEAKYRDRARERRQGKLLRDEDDDNELQLPPPEIPFRSAAEQEFDDIVEKIESGDRNFRSENDTATTKKIPETVNDALEFIQSPPKDVATRFAPLLEYLRYQYLPFNNNYTKTTIDNSSRGGILQRARLTFRMMPCHPSDKIRSWERPLQEFFHGDGEIPKATPITQDILDRLENIWEEKRRQQQKPQQVSPRQLSNDHETKEKAIAEESSDDEDIFGGVGDYDAAAAIKDECEDNGESEMHSDQNGKSSPVIRGHIFGTESDRLSQFHNTTTSSQEEATWPSCGLRALEGNDDNDGIDMDFDARDYEDEERKSKRKRKKKRTDSE
jgi:hypothetical protein